MLSFVVFFCVNFESQKIYEAESCYNDSVTIQGHKVELKQKNKKKNSMWDIVNDFCVRVRTIEKYSYDVDMWIEDTGYTSQ